MDTQWITDIVAVWDVRVSGPIEEILPATCYFAAMGRP